MTDWTKKWRHFMCLLGLHRWSYANRRCGPRFCLDCDEQHYLTSEGWKP